MHTGGLIALSVIIGWAAFITTVIIGVRITRRMRRDVRQLRTQVEAEQIRRRDELLHAVVAQARAGPRHRHLRVVKPPAVLVGVGAAWKMARRHALPLTGLAAAGAVGGLVLTPQVRPTVTPPAPASSVVPSPAADSRAVVSHPAAHKAPQRPAIGVPARPIPPTDAHTVGPVGTPTPTPTAVATGLPVTVQPGVTSAVPTRPLAPVTSALGAVTSVLPPILPPLLPSPTCILKLGGVKVCI